MSYKINLDALSSIYALPAAVVDKHIKLSGAIQLKFLLLGIATPGNIDEKEIASTLAVPVPDVIDALNYWADLGVLASESENKVAVESTTAKNESKPKKKVVSANVVKPTREEVARRGEESPVVARLLREAQVRLGKTLTPNEASTLVWLLDDLNMDPMVILMLISFAKSEGKTGISYVEKIAVEWANEGVTTTEDTEKRIRKVYETRSAWSIVEKALGISHRMPSKKEKEMAYCWICEYKYTADILRRAYDICVDTTTGFSMPYIKRILDGWHKAGVKDLDGLQKHLDEQKKQPQQGKANDKKETFDVGLFNKSLNDLPE